MGAVQNEEVKITTAAATKHPVLFLVAFPWFSIHEGEQSIFTYSALYSCPVGS